MPEIFNHYIKLPRNMDELRHTRERFDKIHNFPGVIGCVDCTHVALFPPPVNKAMYPENAYVNRKGYQSINVQLICDTNLKIINVCARYLGSTHNSFIWNNSNALQFIQNLHTNGLYSFYFLGDSGYALRPWMLTPIADAAPNTPEAVYNERHRSTRSLVERCNGVLKLRFGCLLKHHVLHYAPTKASHIINSCTVLHNMCIDNNLPHIAIDDDDVDNHIQFDFGMNDVALEELQNATLANRVNPDLMAGRRLQQLLMRNHFHN